MIRAFFGITENPFSSRNIQLLSHQQEIVDILKVHTQQGGLCLVLGVPGTGKTVIKEFIKQHCDKQQLIVTIARTLHTYTNTIRILSQAFNIDFNGSHFKCEKRLIEQASNLNRQGKTIITIIDDSHLMDITTLRKLRLLFEDFPKNHNIILIGQPLLLSNLSLAVNQDIKSRVTYSVITKRLNPDDIRGFIFSELDRVTLGHNTFSEEALELIIRSVDGILRNARNLCLSCMIEAARSSKKIIDLDNVNRVLIQPHWRNEADIREF